MSGVGERVPGEGGEATVAGGGAGTHPKEALFVEGVAGDFAVDEAVVVGGVGEVAAWSNAFAGVSFFVSIHPFFYVLFVVHRGVVLSEDDCAGVVLVGVIVCMM